MSKSGDVAFQWEHGKRYKITPRKIAGYKLQNCDPERSLELTLQNVVWAAPEDILVEGMIYYGNAGTVKWLWSLLDTEMRKVAKGIEAFACTPKDDPTKTPYLILIEKSELMLTDEL